jgi:hypothetical protein
MSAEKSENLKITEPDVNAPPSISLSGDDSEDELRSSHNTGSSSHVRDIQRLS